ncbi:MAG: hypothetical protein NTV63_00855 [Candidatus Woesearchaeota archaeon]|nr:hypothetical protein [Candidatus Woesearchaeota archaeon]
MIMNTGELPLYNVTVDIKSCVMMDLNKSYESHSIPILLPNNNYIIKFGDSATIKDFERLWCTPSSDYPYPSISFNPQLNQTQQSITTTCGYCPYIVQIFSDKINRTIESLYRSPVNIIIEVGPSKKQ